MLMPFCIINFLFLLMFASEVGLALWIVSWYVRECTDPVANVISQKQILFKAPNLHDFVVYGGYFYVCRANKNYPNRSSLSLPMTGKKFISCPPPFVRPSIFSLTSRS
jgi:hypothetical protein